MNYPYFAGMDGKCQAELWKHVAESLLFMLKFTACPSVNCNLFITIHSQILSKIILSPKKVSTCRNKFSAVSYIRKRISAEIRGGTNHALYRNHLEAALRGILITFRSDRRLHASQVQILYALCGSAVFIPDVAAGRYRCGHQGSKRDVPPSAGASNNPDLSHRGKSVCAPIRQADGDREPDPRRLSGNGDHRQFRKNHGHFHKIGRGTCRTAQSGI